MSVFHYVAHVFPKSETADRPKTVNIVASSKSEAEFFLSSEYDVMHVMSAREAYGPPVEDI